MLVQVEWVREGEVMWSQGWVERNGQTRSHIPGLDDHISFANYDLQRKGYPSVEKTTDGSLVIDVTPLTDRGVLSEIIGYHGFVLR